jgi:LuxR family maltose regulon positive regulatory protein
MFYIPQLTQVKAWLAQDIAGSHERAGSLLAQLAEIVQQAHLRSALLPVLALQALLNDAQGQESAALAKLEKAIALSQPSSILRVFVDLGTRMADLLVRLRQRGVAPGYISRILAAFGTTAGGHATRGPQTTLGPLVLDPRSPSAVDRRTAGPPVPALVESLTPRERDVLALLAQGLSNQEIADRLVLALGSVKQYTHRIYQKLGVKNRRQAARKATDLDILSPV